MMRGGSAIGGMLLILLTAGCGGPSEAEQDAAAEAREAEASRAAEVEKEEQEAKAADAKRKEQQAAHDACASTTRPLRNALQQMNSRLNIGLNYADYTNRLGDVSVAYDKVVPNINAQSDPACVNSAIKLENAMNEYTKVSNSWDACVEDLYCQFDGEKLEQAQANWLRASTAINRSQKILDRMGP